MPSSTHTQSWSSRIKLGTCNVCYPWKNKCKDLTDTHNILFLSDNFVSRSNFSLVSDNVCQGNFIKVAGILRRDHCIRVRLGINTKAVSTR